MTTLVTHPYGYSLSACECQGGPVIGARKAQTPDCCQVCGYITPEQMSAIVAAARRSSPAFALAERALRKGYELDPEAVLKALGGAVRDV